MCLKVYGEIYFFCVFPWLEKLGNKENMVNFFHLKIKVYGQVTKTLGFRMKLWS